MPENRITVRFKSILKDFWKTKKEPFQSQGFFPLRSGSFYILIGKNLPIKSCIADEGEKQLYSHNNNG